MSLEELYVHPLVELTREICMALPGAEEAIEWKHIVWKVSGNIFAVFRHELDLPFAVSFRPCPDDLDLLFASARIWTTATFDEGTWLALAVDEYDTDWAEVGHYVAKSHEMIRLENA